MTEQFVPALMDLAPGSGTYLNEGIWDHPNWQKEFYGENYDRLLEIKRRYDPDGLFYAVTAVGSEMWEVDEAGRLCQAGDTKTAPVREL